MRKERGKHVLTIVSVVSGDSYSALNVVFAGMSTRKQR
jgi:hypothetical protein